MIEVNLYSIPGGEPSSTTGRCVARARFDKESMGVSVMEFVKGFLKDNLSNFELSSTSNKDIVAFINAEGFMSTNDFACVNYYLNQLGFTVNIQNVADDEDNANGVPTGEIIEWNVINHNFIQYDYPTATKIIATGADDTAAILRKIVSQSGLFDPDKFGGMKNPFTELLNNLDEIKRISGVVNYSIISRIYSLLDQLGIKIFCAVGED